jgi:apocytochrome f
MVITGLVVQAEPAAAYPFWAQENYETPREATGRIVCANCHLAEKPTAVEVPQAVLPDSVFSLQG